MQPRGVLDGQLLYPEARAGDTLRAEADFEIDGISIVSVMAPKEKKREQPGRIELIAPAAPAERVTTQLVGRGDRRPAEGRRGPRDSGRDAGRGGDSRSGRPRTGGGERGFGEGPGGARPTARRTGRGSEGSPAEGAGATSSSGRPAAGDRPPAGGRDQRRRDGGGEARGGRPRADRPDRPDHSPGGSETAGRAPGRRLNPGHAHRSEVMTSLPPEQQPIAEQVLRGGIPAVRTALHLEREKATAEGRPAPNSDSLLAIAEELLPRLKAAEWRDRAEAAAKGADDLALRDLRSVVAGGDLARDDETRALAASLREALEARLAAMREEWVQDMARQLDEGRVVRALRLAARPPEATTRLNAEQNERLRAAASAAMSPDTAPDRWLALLEAVAASPVRRSVTPEGLPAEPGAALLSAAQQQVGRIPSLAGLLGISMPPPPGPARGVPGGNRPPPPRRRPPAGGQGNPPRPPRPPVPSASPPVGAVTPEVETPVTPPEPEPTGVTESPVAPPVADSEPVAPAEPVATSLTEAPATDPQEPQPSS
jgi:hypothetical protein